MSHSHARNTFFFGAIYLCCEKHSFIFCVWGTLFTSALHKFYFNPTTICHCPENPWLRWFSPRCTENRHGLDDSIAWFSCGHPWSEKEIRRGFRHECNQGHVHRMLWINPIDKPFLSVLLDWHPISMLPLACSSLDRIRFCSISNWRDFHCWAAISLLPISFSSTAVNVSLCICQQIQLPLFRFRPVSHSTEMFSRCVEIWRNYLKSIPRVTIF